MDFVLHVGNNREINIGVGKFATRDFCPVVGREHKFVAMRYIFRASAAKHVPENSQHALRIVH